MIPKLFNKTKRPTSVEFGGEIKIEAREGENQSPTFEIQAYNGGKLPVAGFDAPVIVELSSASFEKPVIKVNRNHDRKRELGHTNQQRIDANGIFISGILSVPGQDRDEVVEAAQNDFPWDASIEATFKNPEFVPRGKSINANGQMQSGPFYYARNATITGTAILNRGADRNTVVKIAAEEEVEVDAKKGSAGEATGASVRSQIKRLQSFGYTLAEIGGMVDRDESTLGAILSGEIANPPESLLSALSAIKSKKMEAKRNLMNAELQQFVKDNYQLDAMELDATELAVYESRMVQSQESERVVEVRSICAQYNNPEIEVGEGNDKKKVSLEAHAIREGLSAKEVKLEAMLADTEKRSPAGQVAIHGSYDMEADLEQETLCAAFAQSHFGISEESAGKSYREKAMDMATGQRWRQMSLHDLMGRVCIAAGMPYTGPRKSMEFWAHTQEAQMRLDASGTSTISLQNLFENVLNKRQRDSFELHSGNWRMITHIGSVNDFKPTSNIRLTGKGGYQKVETDGEIKHAGITDDKITNQAETFGVMLGLTRRYIINDDLGALSRVASMLGQMAGVKLNESVWIKLLSNSGSFFSAANKNLLSEGLTDAGLTVVRDAFMNRVDRNKKPIAIGPAYLVHGVGLTNQADRLFTETQFGIGNTQSGSKLEATKNVHRGKYQPIMSPYLSNTDIRDSEGKPIPNQNDNLWFLMAAPTEMLYPIEVVFLNGNQSPTVSTSDMQFNKLGMQYRSFHDFGVEYGDPESIVRSQP